MGNYIEVKEIEMEGPETFRYLNNMGLSNRLTIQTMASAMRNGLIEIKTRPFQVSLCYNPDRDLFYFVKRELI